MKILVTGTHGQLATSLAEAATAMPGLELVTAGRPALELSDPASIRREILSARPDIVVSAAAYTAVDRAEDEQDLAYAVNVIGAAAVADAAATLRIPVIHISTDYVFSGDAGRPYSEDDETEPKTVYGYTKLRGEHAVASANPRHVILRTSWVYSPFGTNFVKTMLRIAGERPAISVVADQWGNPTSAPDLADAILLVATHPARERPGIYHVAGTGDTNWAGLARSVFEASKARGGPFAEVHDIASADYPTRARRPLNSRLCCAKFERTFGWRAPPWQESTVAVVRRVLQPD
ncbi:dTDP-4-dehydrorhamnose reductase [Rhizobium sp. GN54]|uniref:dTDP-4-dehydrorhamnose reductase n=1 Tax=Rhizobium sp. GN54 TaxID=2898150 RepID=UPI001E488218|nr:dTDP-4-dehydrorhamnose reductase [Rhizobium sp. GN54]MCD2184150.1 dTDP-4-dehydrorhamnose reductase [Rhizobium sp. GN54]